MNPPLVSFIIFTFFNKIANYNLLSLIWHKMIFKGVDIHRKQYFIAIMMELERNMEIVQGKRFCESVKFSLSCGTLCGERRIKVNIWWSKGHVMLVGWCMQEYATSTSLLMTVDWYLWVWIRRTYRMTTSHLHASITREWLNYG